MVLVLSDEDLIKSGRELALSLVGFEHLRTPVQEVVLLMGKGILQRRGGAFSGDVSHTVNSPGASYQMSPFKVQIIRALEAAPDNRLILNELLTRIGLKRGYTVHLDELNARGEISFARRQEGWKGNEVISLCN